MRVWVHVPSSTLVGDSYTDPDIRGAVGTSQLTIPSSPVICSHPDSPGVGVLHARLRVVEGT